MAKAGVLIVRQPVFILVLLIGMLSAPPARAFGFEELDAMTPGEQYRQLSLLLLVAGGTQPEFLELMEPAHALAPDGVSLGLDDYVTPLVRIVDQESLLASAHGMIVFARSNLEAIRDRLLLIAGENPILVSMVDTDEIASDAIIIRNAIADSMEYAAFIDAPQADAEIERFREQTIYLRNMMEYNQFEKELAAITNQAITDLGGRLDAYQRMFDEDVDPDLVRRRVQSAEVMNTQTGDRYDEQATMRMNELLMMLILMESQVRR